MKKHLFYLLLVALGTSATAQSIDHISNFQFNLGGGIHSLAYTPADGEHHNGAGILAEAQYQLFFTPNWGLSVGAGLSTLRSSAVYNYGYAVNNVLLPGALYNSNVDIHFYNWRERQDLLCLNVPVELLLRLPIDPMKALQLAAGVSIDHPLRASYHATNGRYTRAAFIDRTNVTYEDLPDHGLGVFNNYPEGSLKNRFNNISLSILAECGIVFNLSETAGLYLGIYGAYAPASIRQQGVEDAQTALLGNNVNGCFSIPDVTTYHSSFGSDRVEAVHPFEAGVKIALRLGTGKRVDWREIEAAERAAQLQLEAERKAAAEAAEAERLAREEQARQQAIAQARAEAEAKAKAEADSLARVHAAELARAKAEADAKAAELARAKAEADSLTQLQAEATAKLKAEAAARAEAEAKARAEAEALARAKAEQRAREEAAFVAGYKDIAYFETGKDIPIFGELNEDSWVNLKDVMAKNPDIRVTVTGHTDNVGKPASNRDLSQRRADNIKQMLVNKGIPADRITAIGKGDTEPIADNKTKQGRAKNRRIEITIGR